MKKLSLIITTILILGSTLQAQEITAKDLMAKGLYEENINGDYEKAGEYYQKILDEFGSEKQIAAQATFRLGISAEKLGQKTAQKYFIDVIEMYPDELELVSKARAKINNTEGIKLFTDDRDGRQYKYVAIGKYYWMAENLAYMPHVSKLNDQGGIWVYDYDGNNPEEASMTDNYHKYGCLYDWETATNSCPDGWKLPNLVEWKNLERFIGIDSPFPNEEGPVAYTDQSFVYKKILDEKSWKPIHYTNITQLSIKPAGIRSGKGEPRIFFFLDQRAYFWTSAYEDFPNVKMIDGGIYNQSSIKEYGYSVRCIKEINNNGDSLGPKIQFRGPISGYKVRGSVYLLTHVRDENPIEKVEFRIKSNKIDTCIGIDWGANLYHQTAYELEWKSDDFQDDIYTVSAIAYDIFENSTSVSIVVEAKNNTHDKLRNKSFIDARDGQEYNYVEIGDQVWMAENLNYTLNENNGSWWYNNLHRNGAQYGRLYDFNSAKLACPNGWHLPDNSEWEELADYVTNNVKDSLHGIAYYIKSISGWNEMTDYKKMEVIPGGGNGNNSTGFNAIAAGEMSEDYFAFKSMSTSYWSSTEHNQSLAFVRSVSMFGHSFELLKLPKIGEGRSVRCVKD